MGSLMAGWNSPVLMDPDTFRAERNRSLTKEEIQSYWREYKKSEEEEGKVDGEELMMKQYSSSAPTSSSFLKNWPAARKQLQAPKSPTTSKTVLPTELGEGFTNQPATKKDNRTGDWWTRSNWAFLNEPPQERNDDSAHMYRPQFDVARIAAAGA